MAYIGLLIISIFLLLVLRTDMRFCLATIPLWIILLFSFFIWQQHYDSKINILDAAYWKSAENQIRGDDKIYSDLNETKKYVLQYNLTFIHLISFQTLLTFLFQILGYRLATMKNIYIWTSGLFGVILLLNLILIIMISVVPTGGIVG